MRAPRKIEAVATDPSLYEPITGPTRAPGAGQGAGARPGARWSCSSTCRCSPATKCRGRRIVAAFANPWPGAVHGAQERERFQLRARHARSRCAASIGETIADFSSGPPWRWDEANALSIRLANGALRLAGRSRRCSAAPTRSRSQNADGAWEVLQFAAADAHRAQRWTLTRLLRGQAGTESAMRDPVAAGARVVLLDGASSQLVAQAGRIRAAVQLSLGPAGQADLRSRLSGRGAAVRGRGLAPAVAGASARGVAGRRSGTLLDPPHAHRRRQLGPDRRAARPRTARPTTSKSSTAAAQ